MGAQANLAQTRLQFGCTLLSPRMALQGPTRPSPVTPVKALPPIDAPRGKECLALSAERSAPRRVPWVPLPPKEKPVVALTVLLPKAGQVQLKMPLENCTADVMARLQDELGEAWQQWGVAEATAAPRDGLSGRSLYLGQQRLLYRGVPLKAEASLEESGLAKRSTLRLMPAIQNLRVGHVDRARRGLLLTPDTKSWTPARAREPLEPLAVGTYAPYCANLQHPTLIKHPPLTAPKPARIANPGAPPPAEPESVPVKGSAAPDASAK
eukprot:NODE_2460_length_931_cov_225.470320.p1 GENE.NODE_2460_length_931_cov_225.470320~~NODE_2460_length_931_cov_225.470320.p1  ORF type:complete len:267 (+),score=50.85 NODE_2460_length_931_cov_225.470320:3-803(+)